MGSNKELGKNQVEVLRCLREHGQWYDGCGWSWDGMYRTRKQMESLLQRGLVTFSDEVVNSIGWKRRVYRPKSPA